MMKKIMTIILFTLTLFTLSVSVYSWFHIQKGSSIEDFKANVENIYQSETLFYLNDIPIDYNNKYFDKSGSMIEVDLFDEKAENYINNLKITSHVEPIIPIYVKYKVILEKRIFKNNSILVDTYANYPIKVTYHDYFSEEENTGYQIYDKKLNSEDESIIYETTNIVVVEEGGITARIGNLDENAKYYVSLIINGIQANRKKNVWGESLKTVDLTVEDGQILDFSILWNNIGLPVNRNYFEIYDADKQVLSFVNQNMKSIYFENGGNYKLKFYLPNYLDFEYVVDENQILVNFYQQLSQKWGFEQLIIAPVAEILKWNKDSLYKEGDIVYLLIDGKKEYFRYIYKNVNAEDGKDKSPDWAGYASYWIQLGQIYNASTEYKSGTIVYYVDTQDNNAGKFWIAFEDTHNHIPGDRGTSGSWAPLSYKWVNYQHYVAYGNYLKLVADNLYGIHGIVADNNHIKSLLTNKASKVLVYYNGVWFQGDSTKVNTQGAPTINDGWADNPWKVVFKSSKYRSGMYILDGQHIKHVAINGDNMPNETLKGTWEISPYSTGSQYDKGIFVKYENNYYIALEKVNRSEIPGVSLKWKFIVQADFKFEKVNEYKENNIYQKGDYVTVDGVGYYSMSDEDMYNIHPVNGENADKKWYKDSNEYQNNKTYQNLDYVMYQGSVYQAFNTEGGTVFGTVPGTPESKGKWQKIMMDYEYERYNTYFQGDLVLYAGYYWQLIDQKSNDLTPVLPGANHNVWKRIEITWNPNRG